jgi:hypothetical protein
VQETPVVITLLATLEDAALLAEYLIRSAPAFWFGNIQIIMNGLTDAQRTIINSLDIGSQVSVTKTFPNSTPSTVTQLMALEGISHDITPDRHIVTLYPNPARIYTYFIVGGYTTTTTRTNLVSNPNFEAGTPNWAGSNPTSVVTTSTTEKYIGSQSLRLERITSTGNLGCALPSQAFDVPAFGIPVTAGNTYTVSAYVYQSVAGTVDIDMNYCFGVTSLVTSPVAFSPTVNTWTRISATVTAPPTADGLRIIVRFLSRPVGEMTYVDAVLVEQASSALPYFDGTYADTYAGYTLQSQSWSGTANGSTSTATWGLTSSLFGSQLDDDTKGLG